MNKRPLMLTSTSKLEPRTQLLFCQHDFFRHLAISEKSFSHNHCTYQCFIGRNHLYPVFMAEEYASSQGRPAKGKDLQCDQKHSDRSSAIQSDAVAIKQNISDI